MKIVFSIYLKLLVFILPLVCLPVAINGRMTVEPRQANGVKVTIELPIGPAETTPSDNLTQETTHEA
jgi:hypothetical protein